jgi:hypothetical protein
MACCGLADIALARNDQQNAVAHTVPARQVAEETGHHIEPLKPAAA